MKVLIIAEHDNKLLKPVMNHIVTAALALGSNYDVMVVGSACQSVAEQAAALSGAATVLLADHAVYEHQLAENTAAVIAAAAKQYETGICRETCLENR